MLKIALISMLLISFSLSADAQEMEPRNYSVLPVGLHATQLSYTFSGGRCRIRFEFTRAEPEY